MARLATPADEISFHDASIGGIGQTADAISISIDLAEFNRLKYAFVCLTGVCRIFRNAVPADQLTMECADGEVLDMKHTGNVVTLLIEWNDYEDHRRSTVAYRVECDSVGIWV